MDTLFEIVYILFFSLEVAAFFYSKVCFKTLLLLKIESFIKFPGVCSLIISSEQKKFQRLLQWLNWEMKLAKMLSFTLAKIIVLAVPKKNP